MTRILAAGDRFITPSLLRSALLDVLGPEPDIVDLTLPWPLEPFGPVGNVYEASGTEDEMIEALDGFGVCVTQMAPLTERVLQASPDLELFCVARGGPVNVDVRAAARHGVTVTSAPGRNAAATAEHTIGLLLAVLRSIVPTHNELRRGEWRGDYYTYESVGMQLDGNTVGLIGYGAVGKRVAAIVAAFGARVLVHDPFVDANEVVDAESVDLDTLLASSSIVSLHARLSADTEQMISADQIGLLPEGAVLVNCARAGLMDYDALCDALDSGALAGAGLDVFPDEPVPAQDRLLKTNNIICTPHIGGASRGTAEKAARIVAKDVELFLAGSTPLHIVSPN